MRSRWRLAGVPLALAALLAAGCAPVEDTTGQAPATTASGTGSGTAAAPDPCAKERLPLTNPGQLTVATDTLGFPPWYVNNKPANGKGFESAVAYAVADELGFGRNEVTWVREPFNKSYQPGAKDFDFDISQISITPEREQAVDFSTGYYQAAQALVVLKGSPYADAASLDDLKDARLGAQVGTTSLSAVQQTLQPEQPPLVYDDTNNAKTALENGQIDGIVVDLPTAFFITAVEIPRGVIVGQFQPSTGRPEEFGLLFEEGNPLVDCVNEALGRLKSSGELERIEQRWLSQVVDVPELS